MNHYAAPDFWVCYRRLPTSTQRLADKAFDLLKDNPSHPSIHLKKVDQFWSARVGIHHRALAVKIPEGMLWFWIGTHAEYDNLVG